MSNTSPSAALRRLCLAGIALSPAVASADPLDFLRRETEPPYPRCTPVPPVDVITVGAPVLSQLPGPANDLVVDHANQEWIVGDGGSVWYRYPRGEWTAQDLGTTNDLNAAAQGQALWIVGDGGTIWARDYNNAWTQHDLPGLGKPDLVHVASDGAVAAVASSDGDLFATLDAGASWERLAGARDGTIRALGTGSGTVAAAGDGGRLLLGRYESDGDGGWRWRTETRALPSEAPAAHTLAVYGPDFFVLLDEAGALWSTYDGGKSWQPPAKGNKPTRALVQTVLGFTAVHPDGTSSVVGLLHSRPVTLQPSENVATHSARVSPPPAGVSVLTASGSQQSGVLALTEDGQLLVQPMSHHIEGGHPCGRPFEVEQAAVCAPAVAGSGWGEAVLPPAALPSAAREALAAAWLRDAQAEHASVASFARFALRLLALGAPAALVSDAQQAMGDEIRHAERCFALASRYAGQPLRPGSLPLTGALDGGADLAAVSVEVLREGAVGESIGALLADSMRQKATDPHVHEALTEIAADEARHARDAWRFLSWAVSAGGAPVRAALAGALEDAIEAHVPAAGAEAPEPPGWGGHGRLTAAEQRRLVRRAVRQVVRPCAAALLRAPAAPAGARLP